MEANDKRRRPTTPQLPTGLALFQVPGDKHIEPFACLPAAGVVNNVGNLGADAPALEAAKGLGLPEPASIGLKPAPADPTVFTGLGLNGIGAHALTVVEGCAADSGLPNTGCAHRPAPALPPVVKGLPGQGITGLLPLPLLLPEALPSGVPRPN